MAIAVNSYSVAQAGLWSPKEQRVVVGDNVMGITASRSGGGPDRVQANVLTDRASISNEAVTAYYAKQAYSPSAGSPEAAVLAASPNSFVLEKFYSGNGTRLSIVDDELWIFKNGEKLPDKHKITGDTRLSFTDGELKIDSGAEIKENGVLKSHASDDILIRLSSCDVDAAKGGIVVNLFAKPGNFSASGNTKFLGNYIDSSFKDLKGTVNFAGNFVDSIFEAKDSINEFSGAFSSTLINGSNFTNKFSGFFNDSILNGGSGADIFNGHFLNSSLFGNAGDDEFGTAISPDHVKSTIVNSLIDAGEGDDVIKGSMFGSQIAMGDGDNEVNGVMIESSLKTGTGSDLISLVYSSESIIEAGSGDDRIVVGTGLNNQINAEGGQNYIEMGFSKDKSSNIEFQRFAGSRWMGHGEYDAAMKSHYNEAELLRTGNEFGTLQNNSINSESGENKISIITSQSFNYLHSKESPNGADLILSAEVPEKEQPDLKKQNEPEEAGSAAEPDAVERAEEENKEHEAVNIDYGGERVVSIKDKDEYVSSAEIFNYYHALRDYLTGKRVEF